MLTFGLEIVRVICSGIDPCKSTVFISGSKPSRVTRTEYVAGFRSGDPNLPVLSDESMIGCTRFLPVISIRAPAMTAPDESWMVPEIVSALSHVGPINPDTSNAILAKEKEKR